MLGTGVHSSVESQVPSLSACPPKCSGTGTVKALGNYTRHLYDCVDRDRGHARRAVRTVRLSNGEDRQVWVVGGVGVPPFLSWAHQMAHEDDRARGVEFYYCMHDRSDAVHTDTFTRVSETLPNVDVALVCSVEEGHFHARDVDDVTDRDVFMCGPNRLTEDLRRQFRRRGVPNRRIHFEDFEFR